jgi:general secretion pathway protein K
MAATAAAESAVNLGIATALMTTPSENVKFPLRCLMPGGERATITVEDESGKVDLNTATPTVLARFFTALSLDQSAGNRIAANILEFREPGAKDRDANEKPNDAKKERFATIMQLDQISGISPHLFRKAIRFVTVSSGAAEPDENAASPALRTLLALDQKQTDPARAPSRASNVTIRADVQTTDGTRFVREALVSFGSEKNRPFLIREWRHGDADSRTPEHTREDFRAPEDRCFRIKGTIRS